MRTPLRLLAALLLLASGLATPASAQTAGTVLWKADVDGFATMSQPRVAPDGTIYLVTNQLYAFAPDGTLKWTGIGYESYVDVGPDGTVYTGAFQTIYAYNPDGSLKWSFTENPGGQGLMQGPTIGPDGNIYAISDLGGLGAFSLTPEGQLRWNVPGFSNNAGTGLGRIQFGPDNLYFAESWVPGCAPLTSGLGSVTLDGQLDWCLPLSGVSRPWATLDGRAITWMGGVSGKTLFAFNPNSTLDWTHTFDFSPVAIGSVVVGPDNNLYVFHDNFTLAKLTADGDVLWEVDQPINNFPWRAAVAPDLSAVVSGSVYGFGNNGIIIAADPADGRTLWSVPVTGPMAGAGAPAEFSADGSVVYVPVNTLSFDAPDQLWAVQVHDGGTTAALDAEVTLVSGAPVPASGGTVRYTVSIANTTTASQTTQYWVEVAQPNGRVLTQGPFSATVAAGAAFTANRSLRLSSRNRSGTYTLTVKVGTHPVTVVDSDAVTFEKLAAAAATASAAGGLPAEYALEAPSPNPSRGRATLRYALPEAARVTLSAYDGLGRRVAVLVDEERGAGYHEAAFDAASLGLPAGVYVVRLEAGPYAETRRLTILR